MATMEHKPELDDMTTAQMRVVLEFLLFNMGCDLRGKLMGSLPGLYLRIFPGVPYGSMDSKLRENWYDPSITDLPKPTFDRLPE